MNPTRVRCHRCLALASLFWIVASLVIADANWPQFRGPESTGVVEDNPKLPLTWSTTENVLWVADVPGLGWSSPVAWGDRIFVTTAVSSAPIESPDKGLYFRGERPVPTDPHKWITLCFDMKTGEKLWERVAHEGVPEHSRHLKNSFASETPVTDGERIYAYFGNVGLFVYDMEGREVWHKKFETVKTRFGWGTAASPVLHQGRLYVVNDNDSLSFLAALDAKTGEQVWRVDRNDEFSNWATPYVWENGMRTEIVTPGTRAVRSYDLDGRLLWHFSGMSTIAIPTPFAHDGLLYISSGYVGDKHRPAYAIRPGASGDISIQEGERSNAFIAWYEPQIGPYNTTPILYKGIFHVLLDRGFFTAYDAKTGKEIYGKKRIADGAGAFTASPWAYNGRIFLLSEDGDTFVIPAGPEFGVEHQNSLGEMCMATPAIASDSLIIRTASKLYRIQSQ